MWIKKKMKPILKGEPLSRLASKSGDLLLQKIGDFKFAIYTNRQSKQLARKQSVFIQW
jgi:hypothetical protein